MMLRKFFYYRPFADLTLCHFLKHRLSLAELSLEDLFDDFAERPITLYQLPKGRWSTQLADIVMLLKIAACSKPKRLMEVGSFRGYTALYMAQHVDPDAEIVTIDRNPDHGEAYQNTQFASMIERRVGEIGPELFQQDQPGSYDFIFLDADHSYDGVKHDTELLLPLLSPNGFLVWHDYANWGYFDGKNGVPELLRELSQQLPIAHIDGSDMAIYSPAWAQDKQDEYQKATRPKASPVGVNPWETPILRG